MINYVNLKYRPKKSDLICLFRMESAMGISAGEAAKNVALESSTGTWTEVQTSRKYMEKLGAKVFSIKKIKNSKRAYWIKIAYPDKLFELNNVPSILSGIAGNLFGMKIIDNIRLEDVSFPASILRAFKGPYLGISGVRKIAGIKKRPFVGTIIKPKLGLNYKDHAMSAYNSWIGGCDVVKDDENLASQKFNEFRKRVKLTLKLKRKAEKITGEKKIYLPNVTAESLEMLNRARYVKRMGGKFVMIDILTAGWSALQTLRNANLGLGIHAHRAMHAAFTRDEKQGISMIVLADFARLIGVDSLHIGTGIGKMEGGIRSIEEIKDEIEKSNVKATTHRLKQNWGKIKPVFAVASGGLHPGHIPFLMKHLGNDIFIQAGGGVHGHPEGSQTGAKAMRQAVDAVMNGKSLRGYSKTHSELKEALDKFGYPKE